MDINQIIGEARAMLDCPLSSWSSDLYAVHCREQAFDAMIRMLESNTPIYQFTYLYLVDIRTHEELSNIDGGLQNVRKISELCSSTILDGRDWDKYVVVPYSLMVHTREICLNDIYRRIIDNHDHVGIFLCFGDYNEWFENPDEIQKSKNNEIKW